MKKFNKLQVGLVTALIVNQAFAAYPVADYGSYPLLTAINASVNGVTASVNAGFGGLNANLQALFRELGSTVNANGDKIANVIDQTGQAQREQNIQQEKNRRIDGARDRLEVPNNICAESASGGSRSVSSTSGAAKGSMRPGAAGGGGISNSAVANAINTPAPAPEIDSARSANVHAQYCDSDDFAAYGGAKACPSVSGNMPGADKRIDSVLSGAGKDGKTPDSTFTQEQADAARMYTQNSVRRSIAPQLKKGQADTVAGAQYIGLMNQFNSIISAAADPQDQRIADSLPNPATKSLLAEALQAPSASTYYNLVASAEAKRSGMMSTREFEQFEVGRRYSNTEYQADLQAMSTDNLAREQIRVTALNTWLTLQLKDEMQRNNILQGQILASLARQEYTPILQQKYKTVTGRMGGN
ncbi:IncI1 plasmid conjugative transfer protein TraW [Acinetobacter junii CIP 107470 = MTCC 11364]|uniref:IncI1 plasmid conjugative transfer protein TraW n=1 Tax=Acinetobacter junii CIP 107470 = MTCC 11364 TaxID=1217666 RepID=S7WRN7_ACIJU|nr:conjugal transfer protein TraW [Acinetobacter junii]ENV52032.1 hypothetical protein F953_00522 [Acinetobacter junii CIP 107470 = MTCC 11364]EPR85841.1 IncI1 plasmid conjugative transfer protein TraW [Acinetobacter junii CIP 107470 = MTCC 11364]